MTRKISVVHLNVQCLHPKIPSLEAFLEVNSHPEILCVSEHWMNTVQSNVTTIRNYVNISSFCRSSHIHGGVAIFCESNFSNLCKRYCTRIYCSEIDIELVAIAVNKHTCIACVYRSPSGKLENFFLKMSLFLTQINLKFERIVIVGDFNIDASACERNEQNNYKYLLDLCHSFNLVNLIKEHTRIDRRKGFHSKKTIDHFFTNIKGATARVFEPNISDHTAQIAKLDFTSLPDSIKDQTDFRRRVYTEQNMRNFCYLFRKDCYSLLGHFTDIDCWYNEFIELVHWCLELSCPKISMNSQKKRQSIDPRIIQEYNGLNFLYHIATTSGDTQLLNSYKVHKKTINKKISKINIENNAEKITSSLNSNKTLWQIVNKKLGRKDIQTDIKLCINDMEIDNKRLVSNVFVEHFSTSAIQKLHSHFNSHISDTCTSVTSNNNTFFFCPVTPQEISETIQSMKNKASRGIDDIPVQLLKYSREVISEALAYFINLSIQLQQFPDALKVGKVIPIHKKGVKTCVENFRPITLLSHISKLTEKIIASRVYNFLETQHLLSNSQYGYRVNRSTELSCTDFIQKVYEYLDKGKKVASLFFDLTSAFDIVNHKFLKTKLYQYGIRGNILNWIISYLTNRKIVVSIDGEFSDEYDVDMGVGQGSTLGPLLFIIFINDLPFHLPTNDIYIYADDTSVIIHADTVEELQIKTKDILQGFKDWCWKNSIIMNTQKTSLIKFSLNSLDNQLTIGDISSSTQIKFLGSLIDSTLTFRGEIDRICEKLAKSTFAILNLKKEISTKALINCYYSLVYSILSYNVILWGQSVEVQRVFIMQKRILRIMFNLGYRESCRRCFTENEIMTVTSIYILKISIYMYKKKNSLTHHRDIHGYSTRQNSNIYIERHNSSKYKLSPLYAGIYIYNKLPYEIKSALTLKIFKRQLRSYLMKSCFYNMHEFNEVVV